MVGVSDIFYFFLLGRGKGESEAPGGGGGVDFLLKILEGGDLQREGPRGREGVCSELGNFWGGGGQIFFSGLKCPPSFIVTETSMHDVAEKGPKSRVLRTHIQKP